MGEEIDKVEFGKMIAQLETLNKALPNLYERLGEVERQLNRGYGIAAGLALAAGGIGAAAHKALEALTKG